MIHQKVKILYLYKKIICQMRIGFLMYPGACFMGPSDGCKMQAVIWRDELIAKGHEVVAISPWEGYDWKAFDIVHVFGFGLWNYDIIHWGSRLNPNFVFSPIIDTNTPMSLYRLASYVGCSRLRLFSQNYAMRKIKNDVRMFFARTQYEANYLTKGYGIEANKISLVPLSYRQDKYDPSVQKESFCLFVGTMTQERKNVPNLILAAKKYGFPLVLVGNTGNEESLHHLKNLIGDSNNIEIKGFVSDEELVSLYNRAKVFALPSLNEGVGLVALEAAIHGCNIVITKLGGPQEYYPRGLARIVNPYDIDEIGYSIHESLLDNSQQPALREYLVSKYNVSRCVDSLIESYEKVLLR